jgi:hypothetical protein
MGEESAELGSKEYGGKRECYRIWKRETENKIERRR